MTLALIVIAWIGCAGFVGMFVGIAGLAFNGWQISKSMSSFHRFMEDARFANRPQPEEEK